MEDEGGRYEVKEEAFVEVMSADDEGEDDDELLDEDDLDGEDIDEVSSHKSTVASKTPVVRRRLKVCKLSYRLRGEKRKSASLLGHS